MGEEIFFQISLLTCAVAVFWRLIGFAVRRVRVKLALREWCSFARAFSCFMTL
jgi:hypothetical protein